MSKVISLAHAIIRSIRHDEIAHADLSDLLAILRIEADEIGDPRTVEMIDNDDRTKKETTALVRQLIDNVQDDHTDCDDVENGDVWEVWGVTENGHAYRVHIRLRQ